MYICVNKDKTKAVYYCKSSGRKVYVISDYPNPSKESNDSCIILLKYKTKKSAIKACLRASEAYNQEFICEEEYILENKREFDGNKKELMLLVRSCRNNMKRKYKGKYKDIVERKCIDFCNENKINIKKKSAYLELCSLYDKYVMEYVLNLSVNKTDLYDFRKNHILSDKEILDNMLEV